MGGQRFDPGAYASAQSTYKHKAREEIFSQTRIHKDLNPLGVKIRESRDSDVNPKSTPIICGVDVTGSMGVLAEQIARNSLGTLFGEIYAKEPVSDPHIAFMAIGDVRTDEAPLQVSQFEAGPQIIDQLTNIYLEGNGGGNNGESYQMPWYFAAFHTKHDAWEKRGKRGYLFTIGDEPAPVELTPAQVKEFIGDDIEAPLSPELLLQMAEKTYKVFHLVVEEGAYAQYQRDEVYRTWRTLLGERVLPLRDYKKLAEVIIGTIAVSEGHDIANYWTGDTAKVVHEAVKALPRGV